MSAANSAQKELQMENKIAGVKPHTKEGWADKYIFELAILARKLRKNNKDADGKDDVYTEIIERRLKKIEAAIEMMESDPTWALELGESGASIDEVLALLERKAAEEVTRDRTKYAMRKVKSTLPQHRLNQMVKITGGLSGDAKKEANKRAQEAQDARYAALDD